MSKKREMTLQQAVDILNEDDDDLPDGAFWAMAHDMCGAEYGDVWDELDAVQKPRKPKAAPAERSLPCPHCSKKFTGEDGRRQHMVVHTPGRPLSKNQKRRMEGRKAA